MRIAGLLVVLACSAPAPAPAPMPGPAPAPRPDAGVPAIIAAALTCDEPAPWSPAQSYLAPHVLHVRVASASPGPVLEQVRCVALDLELAGVIRGEGQVGDHVKLVIRQSMIERYTSRPAGAWWIVEQTLEPGSEYLALCPAGPLASVLRGSCVVVPAAPHLAGMQLVRDVEARQLAGAPLIAALRDRCATADGLAASYVYERLGLEALGDLAIFDALLAVAVERSCALDVRTALIPIAVGFATAREALPQLRHLARAMFVLLAMPEAAMLHDNLIAWLTVVVGLEGAVPASPAAMVFAGDRAARAAATKALAAYRGSTDATKLRAWLR